MRTLSQDTVGNAGKPAKPRWHARLAIGLASTIRSAKERSKERWEIAGLKGDAIYHPIKGGSAISMLAEKGEFELLADVAVNCETVPENARHAVHTLFKHRRRTELSFILAKAEYLGMRMLAKRLTDQLPEEA